MKNLVILLLILFTQVNLFAQKTDAQLKAGATVIRNETLPQRNTAVRVGTHLLDVIDAKENRKSLYVAQGSGAYVLNVDWVTTYPPAKGLTLKVEFTNESASTCTMSVNSGAYTYPIVNNKNGSQLGAGDINAGEIMTLVFDGVNYRALASAEPDVPTTASNGLTATGNNIELGGTLNKNTLVNTNNFGIVFGTGAASATGENSFAVGEFTLASGENSFTSGFKSKATGQNSFASGQNTLASGGLSSASGGNTTASGIASHAGGFSVSEEDTRVVASGIGSFNHSLNTAVQVVGYGANANGSAILGGKDHNIEAGNTNAAIIGGDGINLTGTNYVNTTAVGNLAIMSPPTTGVTGDNILVRNATTGIVRQVPQASIGGGWGLNGNAGTTQATNFIGTTDNIGLSFRTNNTIRQTILPNGFVGINTTTPSQPLTVSGNVFMNQDGSGLMVGAAGTGSLGFIKRTGSPGSITGASGNPIIFAHSDQINLLSNISTAVISERMRIQPSGAVGIGTTNPLNNLQIGTPLVANTGGIRLPITSASAAQTGSPIGVDANGDVVRVASLNLTTTGTTGAATLVGNTLNIPNYSGGASLPFSDAINLLSNAADATKLGKFDLGLTETGTTNTYTLPSTSSRLFGTGQNKINLLTSFTGEVDGSGAIAFGTPTDRLSVIESNATGYISSTVRATNGSFGSTFYRDLTGVTEFTTEAANVTTLSQRISPTSIAFHKQAFGDKLLELNPTGISFFGGTPVPKQAAVTTPQGIANALTAYGLLPASTIASGGTVSTVSVASANGFAGTVANATTTPAITLSTTINGLLKGNGTAMQLAVAGTDYLTPTGSAAGLTSFPTLNQNTTGSAATLTTGRTISMTGDVTYTSPTFNGSANVTAAATLSNTGITAGTYNGITFDAKGRATNAINLPTNWGLAGNAGTAQATDFLGTTDNIGLSLRTNNTIRQTITNTGSVGFGTTTPAAQYHFETAATTTVPTMLVGNGSISGNYGTTYRSATGAGAYVGYLGTPPNGGQSGVGIIAGSAKGISLYTGSNSTNPADATNIPRMSIEPDGNVGIATTNPSNTLHIAAASVANTGGVRLPITSASAAQTGGAIGVNANGDIVKIADAAVGTGFLGATTALTSTSVSAATATDLVSVTLPSAGTYIITYSIQGNVSAGGSPTAQMSAAIYNGANVLYANSEIGTGNIVAGFSGNGGRATNTFPITVSANLIVKLRAWSTATPNFQQALSSATEGRTGITWYRIF